MDELDERLKVIGDASRVASCLRDLGMVDAADKISRLIEAYRRAESSRLQDDAKFFWQWDAVGLESNR